MIELGLSPLPTILIADGEVTVRLSTCNYLERLGYFVVTTATSKEAFTLIEQVQPKLIVVDVTSPPLNTQMNGCTFLRQVRQRPELRLLPVVCLTTQTAAQGRIRGYQMGCDVYLLQPFEFDEFRAVIENLLERSQIIQSQWHGLTQASHPQAIDESTPSLLSLLTSQEQRVLRLLTEGLSNTQIGDRLHLSSRTVEKYVSGLLRKLKCNNRIELICFAIEHHLTE